MDLSPTRIALMMWMLLGSTCSLISFLLTYPNMICAFHLMYGLASVVAFLVLFIGWFDDLTEDSTDWNDDSTPTSTTNWTSIGLASLLIVSMFCGFFSGRAFMPSFDVPFKLYPLEVKETGTFLPVIMSLFGTFFSVITGEEGLKIDLSVIHKAYEHAGWANSLPFALQPARLLANGVWAPLHVWQGQYPLTFGFSVFVSGMVMDSASAQSGSIITNYFIHALFNTVIIIASLITAGALTIVS